MRIAHLLLPTLSATMALSACSGGNDDDDDDITTPTTNNDDDDTTTVDDDDDDTVPESECDGIDLGPYALNVRPDGVTLHWESRDPDCAKFCPMEDGDDTSVCRDAVSTEINIALDDEGQAFADNFGELTGKFYHYTAELADLKPATIYHYNFPMVDPPLGQFTTAPASPAPFTFTAFGDTGSSLLGGRTRNKELVDQMVEIHPAFTLVLGDIKYHSQAMSWMRWFSDEAPLLRQNPIYPTVGNHDTNEVEDLGLTIEEGFPLFYGRLFPQPGPIGESKRYAFDYGGVEFISLNTQEDESVGSPQYLWVEEQLQRVAQRKRDGEAKFIVVYAHKQIHDAQEPDVDGSRAAIWNPLFEQYGVDLYLCGHNHLYNRIEPPNGIVYIITGGGGGAPTYINPDDLNPLDLPYNKAMESVIHFLRVDVDGDTMTTRAYAWDGRLIDTRVITPREVTAP